MWSSALTAWWRDGVVIGGRAAKRGGPYGGVRRHGGKRKTVSRGRPTLRDIVRCLEGRKIIGGWAAVGGGPYGGG